MHWSTIRRRRGAAAPWAWFALWLCTSLACGCASGGGFGAGARERSSWSRSDLTGHSNGAATLSADACYAELSAARVAFEHVPSERARGVRMPVRLLGPVGGVAVHPSDHNPSHAVLDCRLAIVFLSWAPALRRAGVQAIDHYSIYRPGARVHGSGHISGHARGLAIDAARFHLDSGAVIDVSNDWEDRDHDRAPCPRRPDEAWPSRLLRSVVCDAVDRNLFQVVITPHHDRAHENHVHLELKPEVSWSYVR